MSTIGVPSESTARRPPVSGLPPPAPAQLREVRNVLVPIIRGQAAGPLLDIGAAIAGRNASGGTALGLVEIRASRGVGVSAAERSRQLLRWIARADHERPEARVGGFRLQTRVTANPAQSIREVALENRIDLLLLELPLASSPRRYTLTSILRSLAVNPPADLVVARPDRVARDRTQVPESILVPLRGGANAALALSVGLALSRQAGARLTLMHVYDRSHHPDRVAREAAVFHELVRSAGSFDVQVVESFADDPLAALLEAAGQYDAVVMGAHASPRREGLLVGPGMSAALEQLPKTVILARSMAAG
jgi:nucleotide-binding universal stress UspA family protein